jgi:hypothetical protein
LELKIVKNRDSYWIPREKRKFCKEDWKTVLKMNKNSFKGFEERKDV